MEDDRIERMTQLEPDQLRTELEAMDIDELRALAMIVAKRLQNNN